ncbi:hypothetical protein MESS4_120238 [Mesorhizobium sp. STM 4661]|nr:hypothetical protein MESS4_120238 [Mesorhizobium sp. STM 4661]
MDVGYGNASDRTTFYGIRHIFRTECLDMSLSLQGRMFDADRGGRVDRENNRRIDIVCPRLHASERDCGGKQTNAGNAAADAPQRCMKHGVFSSFLA